MSEKINLYVDDLRDCPEGFVIARTVEEAKVYLKDFQIGILSIDHDLGVDDKGKLLPTGYDLVKYICEEGLRADVIALHTDNPVGRDNMYYTLLRAMERGFIDDNIKLYPRPITPNRYSGN